MKISGWEGSTGEKNRGASLKITQPPGKQRHMLGGISQNETRYIDVSAKNKSLKTLKCSSQQPPGRDWQGRGVL